MPHWLPDLLIFLLIMGIVLGIITLVGHGIWLVLAWIFGLILGRSRRQRGAEPRECLFCGRPTPANHPRCDWCGHDLHGQLAAELADLKTLERQLGRLGHCGALEDLAVEDVLSRAQEYRRQLLAPSAAEPFAPQSAISTRPQKAPEKQEAVEVIAVEAVEESSPAVEPAAELPAVVPPRLPAEPQAAEPVESQVPPPPRRSWGEMLAAFMEERNIRWGELIGGLLIVGSSAALVLSLWDTLKEIRYSPFLIFVTISSAIFGVGLYAHHRWKLESTSRGMLTIATLLVPLNFLAMAGFPQGQRTLFTLVLEAASLGLFVWLVGLAARVLVPRGRWLTSLAVVGNSAVVLLASRLLAGEFSHGWMMAVGCLPVAVFAVATFVYLFVTRVKKRFAASDAGAMFTLLGSAGFATTVALGLIAVKAAEAEGLAVALDWLSVPIALAAVPVAACGLRIMRSMIDDGTLEAYRTAGTTIALTGVALKVTALCLAWPHPVGIMVVGTINAAGLTFLALRYRFPIAQGGAMACFALAYLAGFHLLFDQTLRSLPRDELNLYMFRLTVSARSGTALAGLFVLFAVVSEVFARRGRNHHARAYVAGCGVVAVVGLILVSVHGLLSGSEDALRATILYGVYGTGSLALVARWRQVAPSYFGLGLLAAVPMWFLWYRAGQVEPFWAVVAAAEALAAGVIAAVLYGRLSFQAAWRPVAPKPGSAALLDFYRIALLHAAELLACLAIALALLLQWFAAAPLQGLVWPALAAACVAALYLLLAWGYRNAGLFAVHQLMLIAAVLLAVTAWLEHQGRLPSGLLDVFHPHNLHIYGIALALLMLLYAVARILLRGRKPSHNLTLSGRPAVDWVTRHALVGLNLLLIGVYLLPGIFQEWLPGVAAAGKWQLAAGGRGGWILFGVLAAVLIVALWERWRKAELVSTLLLAVTVACLLAVQSVGSLAVASALRWWLAAGFAVCSLPVWGRGELLNRSRRLGIRTDAGRAGPGIARATLVATTVAPVLLLTVLAALVQLAGVTPGGPVAGCFFSRIGPNVSYAVPLLLVTAALVGHAVRERSAGYAFSAGLVLELIVALAYPLSVVTGPKARPFDTAELVTLIQLLTIAAAAWAMAWLIVRRWLNIWRESPSISEGDSPIFAARKSGQSPRYLSVRAKQWPALLMNLQLGMGVGGNVLLLGAAFSALALFHQFGRNTLEWTVVAGSPLGWIALLSVAAACAYRRAESRRSPRPNAVGLFGMAMLGLLACTIQAFWPVWGYRALMLGWAAYSLFVVSVTWWVASVRTLPDAHGPPQAMIRAAAVWVRIAGVLAIVLGLKAAFLHRDWEDVLWAAGAISVAGLAGATMAVWRRREGWAFSAAIAVNLAASLVVWYFNRETPRFDDWWLPLVQANVIASSAVALVWLAARRRLYELRELNLRQSPFLATQVALPAIGNFLLLIVPALAISLEPSYCGVALIERAEPAGWIALLLSALAAVWYVPGAFPGKVMHVLGGVGLGAGVLLACYTGSFSFPTDTDWLEYHALTSCWAVVGLLMLAVGMLGRNLRPAAGVFPASLTQSWTTVVGALVVLLAILHCTEDPAGAWWRIGPVLAASLMAGVIALWGRQAVYVFVSGLLLNVVGSIAWIKWGPQSHISLFQANVPALAAASIAWTLIGAVYWPGVPHFGAHSRPLVFAHLAAAASVALLAVVVAAGVVGDLIPLGHMELGRLDWTALLAAVAAVGICLWDRRARFPLAGLYFLALAAIGMALIYRDLSPGSFLLWTASCELAGFVIVAALLGWGLPLMRPAWTALRIPVEGTGRGDVWFSPVQALWGVAAAALAAWVAIDFSFDSMSDEATALFGLSGRLSGPPAALMLVGAAILMAWQTRGAARARWQFAAMAAGVLFSSSMGWSALSSIPGAPTAVAPWLHRGVNLMVSSAMMTLLAGFGIRQVVPRGNDWIDRGRRAVPVFGCLSLLILAVVLAGEVLMFAGPGVTVATWAVVIVAVALTGLVAGCLGFALVRAWDPMDWPDRRRTTYVYIAEVLGGLICLHLGLTRPEWFDFGIIREYWMLIVMAVAFGGAGLSELFRRVRLPVLGEPLGRTALLLPIVPAVAFWFVPQSASVFSLAFASPTTWLVIGLFYATLAVNRRSPWLGALAILAANTGLWVVWSRKGLDFPTYPQLWLIPIATAALVAEHLDRRRLSATQRAAVRYLALSVIYVSSTTEFLRGIGHSVWPPLILIALCVAGVLLGILLRVRSFLYLGVAFLLVVIVRLIYYAAFEQGRMWVLWTFCIILGAAIIALFALFEKRRNDVLAAMQEFKHWEQ